MKKNVLGLLYAGITLSFALGVLSALYTCFSSFYFQNRLHFLVLTTFCSHLTLSLVLFLGIFAVTVLIDRFIAKSAWRKKEKVLGLGFVLALLAVIVRAADRLLFQATGFTFLSMIKTGLQQISQVIRSEKPLGSIPALIKSYFGVVLIFVAVSVAMIIAFK